MKMIEQGSETLAITLFGPIQAVVAGVPLPPVRSRKILWLLALLTLRYERPVEREWLAGTLWPDVDQEQGFASLRPVLSQLRAALGDQGYRIRSPDRHTLMLDLEGAKADICEFDEAVASERAADLQRAVALYRGPLLEGCNEEWVFQERDVREGACLRALRQLAEVATKRGDPATAADLYRRAAGIDPLSDAPRRGLMETLAASGDVNAALQCYREFAHLLGSEVGTAPDEATTELYARLRADLRKPRGNVPTENRPTPNNLTEPITALVGREDERLDVATKLRRSRLVTLMGVGGIGKTRLANSVATDVLKEYPGGVWFIALDSLTDERMVPLTVAHTLNVREESQRPLLSSIAERLREGRSLLVMDNCEHLLDAAAKMASYLLRECADVRILATSREAMGVPGEAIWSVPTLAYPEPTSLPVGRTTLLRVSLSYESIRLFVERAQAVQPAFALRDDNVEAVVDVCARLEGIPLALELAAARVRSINVQAVAARLKSHQLELLKGSGRGTVTRQQTLRSALDWSYDLMSGPERTLLHRLSVFAGGWSMEAVAQIGIGAEVDEENVVDLLGSLVDKSLVAFDEQRARYRLLEPVRQYALERLMGTGGAAETRRRHRAWFLDLAERAEPGFSGPEQEAWSSRLGADADNLRAALASCDDMPEDGLRLVGALARYWMYRGFYEEGLAQVQRALERAGAELPTPARAKALHGGAIMAVGRGEPRLARELWEESLTLRRDEGDREGVSLALCNLGHLAAEARNYPSAVALIGEALALQREIGNPTGVALVLCNLSTSLRRQGKDAAARPHIEEGLRLYRESGDERMCSWALLQLGDIEYQTGHYDTARTYLEEALAQFRASDYGRGVAWTLDALGRVLVEIDPTTPIDAMLEESFTFFASIDERSSAAVIEAS